MFGQHVTCPHCWGVYDPAFDHTCDPLMLAHIKSFNSPWACCNNATEGATDTAHIDKPLTGSSAMAVEIAGLRSEVLDSVAVIAGLRAEVERLKGRMCHQCDLMKAELSSLRSEVEALREDKADLDWLEPDNTLERDHRQAKVFVLARDMNFRAAIRAARGKR